MNKARIVCEIHTLSQLNGNIVDILDVGPWHIDSQVKIQSLDILEDAPAVISLDHGEMAATFFLSETVESCRDIRMRLKIDPLGNVFEVGYLSNDKLLTEVLMIYHERSVTDDMFDLD